MLHRTNEVQPGNTGAALPPNNHMHHLTSRGRFRFGAITAALAAFTHLATAQAPATTGVNPAATPAATPADTTKKEETKLKRLQEAIQKLAAGNKVGLK